MTGAGMGQRGGRLSVGIDLVRVSKEYTVRDITCSASFWRSNP